MISQVRCGRVVAAFESGAPNTGRFNSSVVAGARARICRCSASVADTTPGSSRSSFTRVVPATSVAVGQWASGNRQFIQRWTQ